MDTGKRRSTMRHGTFRLADQIRQIFFFIVGNLKNAAATKIWIGRSPHHVPPGSLIFFPLLLSTFRCGIACMVSYQRKSPEKEPFDLSALGDAVLTTGDHGYQACHREGNFQTDGYLGGSPHIESIRGATEKLKQNDFYGELFQNEKQRQALEKITETLAEIIHRESRLLIKSIGKLDTQSTDRVTKSLNTLQDVHWCMEREILASIKGVESLMPEPTSVRKESLQMYRNINTVLNGIDRLEVRGRDSAGISIMTTLDTEQYQRLQETIKKEKLEKHWTQRADQTVLTDGGIRFAEVHVDRQPAVTVAVVFKVAAEIGRLGDNVRAIRQTIQQDKILHALLKIPNRCFSVNAHTRWASVGAIIQANCHPVDNVTANPETKKRIIQVSLNGDIDNYLDLMESLSQNSVTISEEITTDTKLIPLQIEHYVDQGFDITEAFRRAVNDFHGSHAICMHTSLAPGKIFLAQKGSGQAIFVGVSPESFMATSEVYGFVEETQHYFKLDGESVVNGFHGPTQGQICILDQGCEGLPDLQSMYYDGTIKKWTEKDIQVTDITSRDIDRQEYPHYYLKEISESPKSVENTLLNRWKIQENGEDLYKIDLGETVIPKKLQKALAKGEIRKIFFIGQGTAGVAAMVCADIMDYYLCEPDLQIRALKASELSGFKLTDRDNSQSMSDTLVVAISQSGTTTDTNRTVDMVRDRGAYTMAIVNRRDSDITFKVDGVMYTSSGRDIEMSVASTKAFYTQIVAGALFGLSAASLRKRRSDAFISSEIAQLLMLPAQMRKVLTQKDQIEASARRLATTRTYWAAVGSGPNKASADEIRIKLSELCYKTISSDYIEDKKHIDLSSEPLIIVCAAGTRETVLGDIIKDAAIFKAHKAASVVIANENDNRFSPYAEDVFHVPAVGEHFAPILNTLVGHLWGYYAALAINESSRFLGGFRIELENALTEQTNRGLDLYEVTLEKSFREKIASFSNAFRGKKQKNLFPTAMGVENTSDLTLLLKYLAGRLPVSDFELDFGTKGTPSNMLNRLFSCLGEMITTLARPVDAIKHQAKTVTVGTSRISEKADGILFEAIANFNCSAVQLINSNIVVLKNLQGIVSSIQGGILYKISGLSVLGELTEKTKIEVLRKTGTLKPIPSRVETDTELKGTKQIIVRQGNIYIGKGRKDDRSIIIIPILSENPDASNTIEHLLLLHIEFHQRVPLDAKKRALGGKFDHIVNIVQENSIIWDDRFIEELPVETLFGRSAEKIGELIAAQKEKTI